MKNVFTTLPYILAITLSSSLLTGCQPVGEILGAGVHIGIFLVAMAAGIILFLITSRPGKNSHKRSLWAGKELKKE